MQDQSTTSKQPSYHSAGGTRSALRGQPRAGRVRAQALQILETTSWQRNLLFSLRVLIELGACAVYTLAPNASERL